MATQLDKLREAIDVNAAASSHDAILEAIADSSGLAEGHFAHHQARHACYAWRFRAIARNPGALGTIVDGIAQGLPTSIAAELPLAKVLAPESAGFFLGNAIARRTNAQLVVCQTDMRRRPTAELLSGTVEPNDRVVIVNDVAVTGASIAVLREMIAERQGVLVGAILFGVVQPDRFRADCERLELAHHWLVTGTWPTYAPGAACPGCKAGEPLIPIAEFA